MMIRRTLRALFISIVLMLLCVGVSTAQVSPVGDLRSLLEQKAVAPLHAAYPQWQDAVVTVNGIFTERSLEQMRPFQGQCDIVLDISCRSSNVPGTKQIMKVILQDREGNKRSFYFTAMVSAIAPRYVAVRDIQAKELLSPEMFRRVPLDIASCNARLITDLSAIAGYESKGTIKAGEPLRTWMVGPHPVFRKGAEVNMIYAAEDVVLRLKGRAVEDGYIGKQITCYRLNSSKRFKVKVIDERTVLIDK